jgi:hypothetical protein
MTSTMLDDRLLVIHPCILKEGISLFKKKKKNGLAPHATMKIISSYELMSYLRKKKKC